MALAGKILLFMAAVALCLVFGGSPLDAKHKDEFDHEEALERMREKIAHEEEQLKRFSEMARIPEGTFLMGRNGVNPDEEPAHPVYLQAFDINKYEVTQIQFLEVMETNPSYFQGCPLCPVEKVTFYQAEQYCLKVGKRLPTEAEWEKAARGGTATVYSWGNDRISLHAWFGNNAGKQTQPVGQRQPNPYGLYDMAGNVWEWVRDWYDPKYYSVSPKRNPQGPATGKLKVIRGGSWGNTPAQIAHPIRDSREPGTRYINGGFRCARDAGRK